MEANTKQYLYIGIGIGVIGFVYIYLHNRASSVSDNSVTVSDNSADAGMYPALVGMDNGDGELQALIAKILNGDSSSTNTNTTTPSTGLQGIGDMNPGSGTPTDTGVGMIYVAPSPSYSNDSSTAVEAGHTTPIYPISGGGGKLALP